jgi:hypothetical protein
MNGFTDSMKPIMIARELMRLCGLSSYATFGKLEFQIVWANIPIIQYR